MRKQIRTVSVLLLMAVLVFTASCGKGSSDTELEKAQAKTGKRYVTMKVKGKTFKVKLASNKTAKRFRKMLPRKFKMEELNGNEKFYYLNRSLPSKPVAVKKIKAGDVMLYGDDCIVIFYKSFKTSYEYTRIGKVVKTKGLKKALGRGDVKVRFK